MLQDFILKPCPKILFYLLLTFVGFLTAWNKVFTCPVMYSSLAAVSLGFDEGGRGRDLEAENKNYPWLSIFANRSFLLIAIDKEIFL